MLKSLREKQNVFVDNHRASAADTACNVGCRTARAGPARTEADG
jgi:hypothetical protein